MWHVCVCVYVCLQRQACGMCAEVCSQLALFVFVALCIRSLLTLVRTSGMWHVCQELFCWLLSAQSAPLIKVSLSLSLYLYLSLSRARAPSLSLSRARSLARACSLSPKVVNMNVPHFCLLLYYQRFVLSSLCNNTTYIIFKMLFVHGVRG